MYFAYLFNTQTGEIKYSNSQKETREILSEKHWEQLSQKEYDRIYLAISWAKKSPIA